jgi:hypothetical protein
VIQVCRNSVRAGTTGISIDDIYNPAVPKLSLKILQCTENDKQHQSDMSLPVVDSFAHQCLTPLKRLLFLKLQTFWLSPNTSLPKILLFPSSLHFTTNPLQFMIILPMLSSCFRWEVDEGFDGDVKPGVWYIRTLIWGVLILSTLTSSSTKLPNNQTTKLPNYQPNQLSYSTSCPKYLLAPPNQTQTHQNGPPIPHRPKSLPQPSLLFIYLIPTYPGNLRAILTIYHIHHPPLWKRFTSFFQVISHYPDKSAGWAGVRDGKEKEAGEEEGGYWEVVLGRVVGDWVVSFIN